MRFGFIVSSTFDSGTSIDIEKPLASLELPEASVARLVGMENGPIIDDAFDWARMFN